MTGPRTLSLVAAVLLAGVAACSNDSPVAQGTGQPTPGRPVLTPKVKPLATIPNPNRTAPDEEHPEGEASGPAQHASDKYSRESPPPSGFRRADSGESRSGNGRLDLLVKIEPPCVEMGDFVTFTAKTKPGVDVAFLTNIPDRQGRAREEAGKADDQGLFSWVLAVPNYIREDQYTLFAAAADSVGDDGGISGTWFHYVAIPDACP